jgi:predicted Ser/Thr protein kinase
MAHVSLDEACPSEEDIAAFVRGCMVASRRSALEAHVAGCVACRQLLSALARAAGSESQPGGDSVAPTLPMATSTSETELPRGARFGRYVVLDWLGAGGMGVVYSAYDPDLNRKVALKVLRNDGPDRLPTRDLLLAEAQAMAQLAHPNVVTVFDVGSVDDRVFLAMELIEGQTLSSWLRARRRKHSEILAMFVAAGNGLAAAHAAGLIHRDFKPDNVLVGNDGRVRVTDFGLARAAPQEPDSAARGPSDPVAASAPQTGLAGTLAYMAPEQYLRRSADARADQFSFAVALYEALYGERPFGSPPVSGDPAAVTTPRRGDVPAAVRQVLLRALRRDPDQRYPSITELLAALAPPPRRARSLAIAAIVVVTAAVAAASGYAIHLRRADEERLDLMSRIDQVSRLRSLAPELRTVLRSAHMLPLHDIRPARDRVRSAIRDVERQQQAAAAQDETAVIAFVLGEAHRALGDRERALGLLEQAWAAGERGPEIDAALGDMLGASYWNQLEQLDSTVPSSEREGRIRAIETRYRDPAMAHLRAALAARASSPAYLEALIAFHDHHFEDAIRSASTAWTESPTLYEAGMLEASAHHEAGRALLMANRGDAARQEFVVARQIFERVLEIARSDDDAWLRFGEMIFAQAVDLGNNGDLPPDLRQQAIGALRTVREINPDRWDAILSEVEIHEHDANLALLSYRDPRPHVDRALAMVEEARAHGAAAARVDNLVCLVYWERAVYGSTHGVDPRADFAGAAAACERAVAAKPDLDNHGSLGAVYASRAAYEAKHGGDPVRSFELGERGFRASLAISDDALGHYNLGRLWSIRAHYQTDHGDDPRRWVDAAVAEFDTSVRMDATRCDALAAIGEVLAARARFEQAEHGNPRQTIAEAREALDRALAVDAALVPPIKYRIELAEIEAEALLADHADPAAAVTAMRADAQQLLRRRPEDGFTHLLACRAELLAARSALARGAASDAFLARAAAEAAHAREADPMDASAWTASAEVEQLRAEAARSHGAASAAAIARGLAFIDQAMKIDRRLVQARRVRDELARQAQAQAAPDAARGAVGR